MEYLKTYESFSIGGSVYIIVTDDEKYAFTNQEVDNHDGVVHTYEFRSVDDLSMDKKPKIFTSKSDAENRMDYMQRGSYTTQGENWYDQEIEVDVEVIIRNNNGFKDMEDYQIEDLKIIKMFMGLMEDDGEIDL